MIFRLEDLFPHEIEERLKEHPALVQPIGTIEWHSHHLPVGFDGLLAAALGEAIAETSGAVLAPTTYFAVGGVSFPFTFQLETKLIEPLYERLFEQYVGMGFRVVLAFTGHFGLDQTLAVKRAATTVMTNSAITILPITTYDLIADMYAGDHAAVGETSLLLAISPQRVRMKAIEPSESLPGIIGEDPRGRANPELGHSLKHALVGRAEHELRRHLRADPLERGAYLDALSAGVKVLSLTQGERSTRPKAEVPPVTTPAYLLHCQALWSGDYEKARRKAEEKLHDLRQ